MKVLLVIDMQNDFIHGALGTPEAQAIVSRVADKIRNFADGLVIYTRDTHEPGYLSTQEGKNLPVPHCIRGQAGWQLHDEIQALVQDSPVIDKPSFGSVELAEYLSSLDNAPESIELVGLCTDICVISNAMILKAYLPEVPIFVDASCCAGVTPQSHENALSAMRMCQIGVL